MFKKKIILPLLVVFALALTGCTTDGDVDKDSNPEKPPVENNNGVDAGDNGVNAPDVNVGDEISDVKIKAMEAFDSFMEKYPEAKVSKIELDEEMGTYLYKIEAFDNEKEYEVKMDAKNGEFLKDEVEKDVIDEDEKDEVITKAHIEKIDALVKEALTDAGEGAKLDQWTLDYDNNMPMLEVEINKEGLDDVDYKYNIETGELVEKDN